MKILIHAVPARMWYVENFLIPDLYAQGAAYEEVTVYLDDRKLGNLDACMDAFSRCDGDGGTWHIQDDVLLCRDFMTRCRQLDTEDLVVGFCARFFGDDPDLTGRVYMPDLWHSFQCIRIKNQWARECSEWVRSGAWQTSPSIELPVLREQNKGDDTFFREYMLECHGRETAYNAAPCLVEHMDRVIGGSVANEWRGLWVRAALWDDEELVDDLRERIRAFRNR